MPSKHSLASFHQSSLPCQLVDTYLHWQVCTLMASTDPAAVHINACTGLLSHSPHPWAPSPIPGPSPPTPWALSPIPSDLGPLAVPPHPRPPLQFPHPLSPHPRAPSPISHPSPSFPFPSPPGTLPIPSFLAPVAFPLTLGLLP